MPYAENGPHEIPNSLLLRADLHKLFDRGYVTVAPDQPFRVSPRFERDFHNGRNLLCARGAGDRAAGGSGVLAEPGDTGVEFGGVASGALTGRSAGEVMIKAFPSHRSDSLP